MNVSLRWIASSPGGVPLAHPSVVCVAPSFGVFSPPPSRSKMATPIPRSFSKEGFKRVPHILRVYPHRVDSPGAPKQGGKVLNFQRLKRSLFEASPGKFHHLMVGQTDFFSR